MGTVYLGRSDTGRIAAVKTMHARTAADPVLRTRFRLETDAARVIGGHHGARVFDADTVRETPWLATEYVIGPPLDDVCLLYTSGPLPEPAVRALGSLLCAALGRLHDSDVVHRDLKPSNIMLTADGPKVIDFGIARAIGDDRLTRAGAAAGTPAFMSPEQATGGEHTAAGDVFALAGVLVHAATGRGPFGVGQAADLLYRVRYAEPDLTGVPAALVPLLRPCLDKDPRQRPTTARLRSRLGGDEGDFASLLPQPLLTDIARRATEVWRVEPRRLPPPAGHAVADTVPEGERTGPSRRRLLALGGGTVLGVAAAGAGAWAWLGDRSGGTPARPGPSRSAEPAWDLLWQVTADYSDPLVPPTPLLLDRLVVVGEYDVKGLDPRTGKALWPDPSVWFGRRSATDGKRIHTLDYTADEAAPLSLCPVDPADGKTGDPLLRLKDLNGGLYGTQLLCATGSAVYAVGGRGPQPSGSGGNNSFHKDQTWHLLALDLRGRRKVWDVPLPARPDRSERLHVLSAQVSGDRLVLVQQSADGATELVVRSTRTGQLLWSRPLDSEQPAFGRAHLAVDDRYVYPSAGRLLALDLNDGKTAWQYDNGRSGAGFSPAAVKNGVVYAVRAGRGIVAVDARSGEQRWAEKSGDAGSADLDAPPVIGIAYVYRKASAGLAATELADGATTRPVKAAAKARYFAHEPSRRLIALGEQYAAGYPLL